MPSSMVMCGAALLAIYVDDTNTILSVSVSALVCGLKQGVFSTSPQRCERISICCFYYLHCKACYYNFLL